MGNRPYRDPENPMIYLTTPIGLTSCCRNLMTDPDVRSALNHDLILCMHTEPGADCILTDRKHLLNGNWHSPLLVFGTATLEALGQQDESIARLLDYHANNQPDAIRNKILYLTFYFSLNPVPSPVTLIERWLTDAGIESARAIRLAKDVYELRTGISDSTVDQIENYVKLAAGKSLPDSHKIHVQVPDSLDEAFNLKVAKPWQMPLFDQFAEPGSSEEDLYFFADQLAETCMLVEDHACIVAGLSISVTRLARITESGYPFFFNSLLHTIQIAQRDIYSLGRLLNEHPDLFALLANRYNVKIHVISVNQAHAYFAAEFSPGKGLSSCYIPDTLPVLLRLTK